ncbi:MAG: spore coat protein CotH [Clostridiaceae bacterium]|nr:spore coat protein CotH [Clostridiaceae bacterium]
MSTHKHIDKICCVVLALTLILSVLFVNAEHLGVQKASAVMGYEKMLFDTSKVHTINIIMDDWDNFIENCKREEYYSCSVVIDNEVYKNVAIRGKGNTSLSLVNNDRYSFKIEFDHYDSTNTYHGLDKLCLNNVIQDNTYMKDYLTYQMMNKMGVASPLCSYVYITVNGEDWGLYLAVEGVEESFLQRNFGKDYGELYKPDSMSMGGGRGNGKKFDMNEFFGDSKSENTDNNTGTNGSQNQNNNFGNGGFPQMSNDNTDGNSNNQRPGGMQWGQRPSGNQGGFGVGQKPEGMTPPMTPPTDNGNNFGGGIPGGMTPPTTDGNTDNNTDKKGMPGVGGSMRNGSDDVLLKYIDDDIDSYSNIFENAKTDITKNDKTRLINALKKLSNGEDLESTVEIDAVIRYFVVHNFVLNFDSYTGSMIHNYYLYEKDGQMQMIPWDYNLAFGGFQSMGDATSLVNYPIDSPVFGGNVEDRPMIAWIFENEGYTELYHQYFSEFIATYFDSGYFTEMIDKVSSMISPYVEKDSTKFCTNEEFKTGISTLKEFCLRRAKSISGQLDGTIGSTSDTQKSDTLINAGDIQIIAMGSMGGGMAWPSGNRQNPQGNIDNSGTQQTLPSNSDTGNNDSSTETPSGDSDNTENNVNNNNSIPKIPGGMQGGTPPDFSNGENGNTPKGGFGGQMQRPDGNTRPNDNDQTRQQTQNTIPTSSWIIFGISALVLAMGLGFAFTYKRRK